jgi:CubicO group peptidase (beta-lactamase class C family)
MRLRTLLTFVAISIFFALTAQKPRIDSLDRALTQLAADGNLSGNLLLAEGNKVLLRKSYGYADFTNKKPLREDAVLELASVSKQFTAAAISLLVADGKIDLDAPAAKYLPELAAYPTLTTRNLIYHTGGLPDYMGMAEEVEKAPEFVTNQFVLDFLRDEKPEREFAPGDKFEYSNTGYLVLASLVERVSAQPFGHFLSERIFKPLGMTNSQVYRRRYESSRKVDGFVPGYVWDEDRYVIPDSLEEMSFVVTLDGVFGDGMVNSTLDDLYRWDRALASGKLLDTTLLFTPGQIKDGTSTAYAFGQGVRQHPKYGYTISHSGGWPGVATYIYRFPETDRTLILLRNDGGGRNDRINVLRNALHALHDMPLDRESLSPKQATSVDVEKVNDLLGTYAISPDFKLSFFVKEGKFMTEATGQGALELGGNKVEDRYSLLAVDADIQFHRDEAGKVTSLTLFQGGQEVPAKREE